jgi:hypothetical protein
MRMLVATGFALAIGIAAADGARAAPIRAAALVEAAGTLAGAEQVQYRPGHYRRGYTIRDQMIRDSHRAWRERIRIRQATSTRMFDETRRVTINRARNMDRAHRAMQDYLRR